jgi:hypothetical protein
LLFGMRCFKRLLGKLRVAGETLFDRRTGANNRYSMWDMVAGAFSMFFMQSESFLEHQRLLQEKTGNSNCRTLFEMSGIPGDDHIRKMLDGTDPHHFDHVFHEAVKMVRQEKNFSAFRRLGDHVLIALDGTEYCRSTKVQCEKCSHCEHKNGQIDYFHTFVGASIVAPGQTRAIPLPPEFITPQDGHDKQDCEQMAGQRWLGKHGPTYAEFKPIYLGDDLYAKQPMCEKVLSVGGHFIFTCKLSSHPTIAEYIKDAKFKNHQETHGKGKAKRTYTYRWIENVPIRDSKDALKVNWMELRITDPAGKQTYHNDFIVDFPITSKNVAEIGSCGRSRWKVENETFNVLKTKGYHLEHNFGHGKETLASVLLILNLLAFAFHTACYLVEPLWKYAMEYWAKRRTFFERLRNITIDRTFETWDALLNAISGGGRARRRPAARSGVP